MFALQIICVQTLGVIQRFILFFSLTLHLTPLSPDLPVCGLLHYYSEVHHMLEGQHHIIFWLGRLQSSRIDIKIIDQKTWLLSLHWNWSFCCKPSICDNAVFFVPYYHRLNCWASPRVLHFATFSIPLFGFTLSDCSHFFAFVHFCSLPRSSH